MNDNDSRKKDPDKILNSIKRDEFRNQRGKLKIFFGMAAGVGKTFAMLEYSHRLKNEGVDVVIGYIETHGRVETVKLVDGFEIIPRKKIEYKGIQIEEMDIDAVINRKPKAVLIDELAHSNTEGSRHPKRYLDILEILDYGIDVFTTLNIQHLESYSVTVEEITKVKVQETLPDLVLEYADNVELIDITPEELIKRLEEGKVYTKEKSKTAIDNFFKKENLTALREMSLRYTAKKVDRQLQEFLEPQNKIWKTGERILVAVGPSPYSKYIIKWTKRTSYNLKAEWIAVYVERKVKLNEKEEISLKSNLDLVRELGAEVIITSDDDIVSGILRVAYQKNITQIIVGKPLNKNIIERIKGSGIVDRLIMESGDIDIYIVTEPGAKVKPKFRFYFKMESSFKKFSMSLLIVSLVTIINLFLLNITGYWAIGLIYLFVVSLIAIFLGQGPVLLSAVLSSLLWDLLFIPPRFTFFISKIEDIFMLAMYFIVALITGNLTSRLHTKELALRLREKRISDLYEISSSVSSIFQIDKIIKNSVNLIEKFLNAKTVFILKDKNNYLENKPHSESTFQISDKELSVANWSFDNKKPAGRSTDTLPSSEGYYLPLLGANGIYGIIGLNFGELKNLSLEKENFVKTVVKLITIAIERFYLIEESQNIKVSEESDRIHKIIFNSISHELRTPLTSISNAAGGLMDDIMFANEDVRNILLNDIKDSTERMNRIVGNLLDMVRLESGKFKLNLEWNDINDIVNVVSNKLAEKLKNYNFIKKIEPELPLINVDFGFLEQVLTNILINAMQYNVEGTEIILKVYKNENIIYFVVRDNGIGIPDNDIDKIFDKFYRGIKSQTGGTGLGLSICKSIIEMHKGKIFAQNNEDKGVSFIIQLPVNEVKFEREL